MEFSRQEYWSGLPCPSPGDLPDPEIKLGSSSLQADPLPSEPPGKPNKLLFICYLKEILLKIQQNLGWESLMMQQLFVGMQKYFMDKT